jgi:endoglucanase
MVFVVLFVSCATTAVAQDTGSEELIRLNQIGFYPDAPKKAVIDRDISGSFYIVSEQTAERVFSSALDEGRKSEYGNKIVRIADFSSFSEPGSYRLLIPGMGHSYPFRIDTSIYKKVAQASLKGYYFQRASTELSRKFAEKWHRRAGHPDDSVLVHESAATRKRPEGTVVNAPKGWYDAGDYNKYIVNSGITMGTLLSLYEDFPAYAKEIEIDIPEQNNGIPDLLDELLWNLRWMQSMQDPNDGGVYHKLTSPDFSGKVMPEEDQDIRYVIQKSTAATLDFAAVMAQASRIFREFDQQLPGLSDSCRSAAKEAWKWAQENPRQIYDQEQLNNRYTPNINTGAYGDRNLEDEFFWAASELYLTTGDEEYFKTIESYLNDDLALPSWSQVGALGYYSILRFPEKLRSKNKKVITKIEEKVVELADELVEEGRSTAYQTVMGANSDHFIWGSNSVAANQGILLIQAYKQRPERKYIKAALSNIDYLLGRNATGYSFVTGYGDKTPFYPHHRPSEADNVDSPVPGLLVGGPNPGQRDGCNYPSDFSNQSYVDSWCSYASNEIAINWNAPLVYLLFAIENLNNK